MVLFEIHQSSKVTFRTNCAFPLSIHLKYFLGGDYMIPVCRDEISPRPAGTNLTLRLYVKIKFRPGNAGQFST